MKLHYIETENGHTTNELEFPFETPEEFRALVKEEQTMAPNASKALADWDGKEPLVVTFSTRTNTVGTWTVTE